MKFLKSSSFWLTLAHVAVAGASIAGTVMFPAATPAIIAGQALLNGVIPSPIPVSSPVAPPPASPPAK